MFGAGSGWRGGKRPWWGLEEGTGCCCGIFLCELIFVFGGEFPRRVVKGTLQLGCPNFPSGVYLPMAVKVGEG